MARTISSTAKKAGNKSQTNQIFLYLLEIDHTDLPEPIRVVNNREDIISNGITYLACGFDFIPPTENDGEIMPAKLTIDNVDRRIVQAVRTITSPATVKASVILASNPNYVEMGPLEMTLKNVSYNRQTVTGDILYLQYIEKQVSKIMVNTQNFPGLAEWT